MNKLIETAKELDRILESGIEILPNSPIHEKLKQALRQPAVMRRLKAVQTLRSNPDLLLLMAEFKRANFVGSYIIHYQIETEEELAAVWLSQMEAQLFRSNGA
jgi:hypothetical protein